jgi:hypothetical protein
MQPHEDEADVSRSQDPPGGTAGHESGEDDQAEAPPGPAAREEDPVAATADDQPEARADTGRPRRERDRRPEARAQDRVEGLRAAVLLFARAQLAPLSAEDAAAIGALSDERALTELVDTLAQAENVVDARTVLDAAIAGTRK